MEIQLTRTNFISICAMFDRAPSLVKWRLSLLLISALLSSAHASAESDGLWGIGSLTSINRDHNYYDNWKYPSYTAAGHAFCDEMLSGNPQIASYTTSVLSIGYDPFIGPMGLKCEYTDHNGDSGFLGQFFLSKISPCNSYGRWPDIPEGQCDSDPENLGESCPMTAHPVNPLTGNKFFKETDYIGQGVFPIKVSRYFNSYGFGWYWDYFQVLTITDIAPTLPRIASLTRPDGRVYTFTEIDSQWQGGLDDRMALTETAAGYQLLLPDDSIEVYDAAGRLQTITTRSGLTQTLTYLDEGIQVESDSGDRIYFSVNNLGQIESLELLDGSIYRYSYNSTNSLEYISYPDSSPNQSGSNPFGEDNPFREIHYENTTFTHFVTGITDETGNRVSTVTYDQNGRAVLSEVAGGIGATQFDYTYLEDSSDPRVTLTNSLGKATTYRYEATEGLRKRTQTDGHASPNCAASSRNITYDVNGFKDLVTDWEGNVTDYDYDAEGREVSRTEALGTPEEKVILTEWHADYRLPTKMTYPDKIVDFVYDADGHLLSRTESPNSF